MQHTKIPVPQYFYSEDEWARLGCGPLPPERARNHQLKTAHIKDYTVVDNLGTKGYNK